MNSSARIRNFFEHYKFIEKVKQEFPDANWIDCLSQGQIDSKLWVINKLLPINRDLGTIFIYGGWYGTLARFILETELTFKVIRSFDFDETCHVIAETVNRPWVMNGWKFKATTYDVFDITYPLVYNTLRRDGGEVSLEETPDTIINTSCEHMSPCWYDDVPSGTLMILQSNNFDIPEHIDYVEGTEELLLKFPMQEVLYSGGKGLQKFDRYMLIGYK